MKTPFRFLLLPGVACLFVLVSALSWGAGLLSMGSSSPLQTYWREMVRNEDLAQRDQVVRQCIQGKYEVMASVESGRMSVAEAVERFRQFNVLMADADVDTGDHDHADDSLELAREHFVSWVTTQFRLKPERCRAILLRVEKEVPAERSHSTNFATEISLPR